MFKLFLKQKKIIKQVKTLDDGKRLCFPQDEESNFVLREMINSGRLMGDTSRHMAIASEINSMYNRPINSQFILSAIGWVIIPFLLLIVAIMAL